MKPCLLCFALTLAAVISLAALGADAVGGIAKNNLGTDFDIRKALASMTPQAEMAALATLFEVGMGHPYDEHEAHMSMLTAAERRQKLCGIKLGQRHSMSAGIPRPNPFPGHDWLAEPSLASQLSVLDTNGRVHLVETLTNEALEEFISVVSNDTGYQDVRNQAVRSLISKYRTGEVKKSQLEYALLRIAVHAPPQTEGLAALAYYNLNHLDRRVVPDSDKINDLVSGRIPVSDITDFQRQVGAYLMVGRIKLDLDIQALRKAVDEGAVLLPLEIDQKPPLYDRWGLSFAQQTLTDEWLIDGIMDPLLLQFADDVRTLFSNPLLRHQIQGELARSLEAREVSELEWHEGRQALDGHSRIVRLDTALRASRTRLQNKLQDSETGRRVLRAMAVMNVIFGEVDALHSERDVNGLYRFVSQHINRYLDRIDHWFRMDLGPAFGADQNSLQNWLTLFCGSLNENPETPYGSYEKFRLKGMGNFGRGS